jgi:hypothetical protein
MGAMKLTSKVDQLKKVQNTQMLKYGDLLFIT